MAPLGAPVHMLNVLTLKAGPGVVPERVFWVCEGNEHISTVFHFFQLFLTIFSMLLPTRYG